MNDSRAAILSKISTALQSEAGRIKSSPPHPPKGMLNDKGISLGGHFKKAFEAVGGNFYSVSTLDDARKTLEGIFRQAGAEEVCVWDNDSLREWQLETLWQGGAFKAKNISRLSAVKSALLDCKVGLTSVDFALADTGTLLQISREHEPRSLSLLPTIHVALVKSHQLISGLDEALALIFGGEIKEGNQLPAALTLITGPSRTADIEQVLTIGVHGPTELHVILI